MHVMAALLDSYQPEGVGFSSQHYPGAAGAFVEDPGEVDEGDIVKSKPQGKINNTSYLPLVNEVPREDELMERLGGGGGGGAGERVGGRSGGGNKRSSSSGSSSGRVHQKQTTQQSTFPPPPNGQIPSMGGESAILPHQSSSSAIAGSGGRPGPGLTAGEPQGTTRTSLAGRGVANPQEEEEEEEEEEGDRGLEESTTALLRRYTVERNGRPASIHLGPMGEIMGSGWLSEILITGHKKCSVTLEEDSIRWRFLSRKEGMVTLLGV